jgi:hypothetical protein
LKTKLTKTTKKTPRQTSSTTDGADVVSTSAATYSAAPVLTTQFVDTSSSAVVAPENREKVAFGLSMGLKRKAEGDAELLEESLSKRAKE